MRKLLMCLLLLCVAVALVPGTLSSAANSKITLTPSTKKETYGKIKISVSSSLSSKDIYKIEWKKGKIKNIENKYWKNAKDITKSKSFKVKKNGYYSVRVIDKKENAYVETIRVKNIKKAKYHGNMTGYIRNVSERDKNGEYTIGIDFADQINCPVSDLWGRRMGDTVTVMGNKGVIADILSRPGLDEYGELTVRYSVVDNEAYHVIVRFDEFDNHCVYFDGKKKKESEIGFRLEGNRYFAYSEIYYGSTFEWKYPELYFVEKNVKFRITKNTIVNYPFREPIGGLEFFKNPISNGPLSIKEKYDKKNNHFTNIIEEINYDYTG